MNINIYNDIKETIDKWLLLKNINVN
jgi:hypothetical protein